jgi:CheY-like chemotaxis protein
LPNESDIPIEVIGKMTTLKGQYNFLVAEDNETNYTLIRSMLPHDCTTNRAINGIEVVNMAKSGQYDAVIMDIKMPLMDGLEATKAIRRFNEEIPIIAVTAHSFENDKRMALEAGCNEYIAKPIKREALLYVIAKALHEDSM